LAASAPNRPRDSPHLPQKRRNIGQDRQPVRGKAASLEDRRALFLDTLIRSTPTKDLHVVLNFAAEALFQMHAQR
jgi:hypothetical protein